MERWKTGGEVILRSTERGKSHLFIQSCGLDWISLIFIWSLGGAASPVGVGWKSHLFSRESKFVFEQLHGFPFDWHFPVAVGSGASLVPPCPGGRWRGQVRRRWQCVAILVRAAPPLAADLLSQPLQSNQTALNTVYSTCNLLPSTLKPLWDASVSSAVLVYWQEDILW